MPTLEWCAKDCIKKFSPNSTEIKSGYKKTRRHALSEISDDDIINAYEYMARIVIVYGNKYLPILKRLHDDVTKIKSEQEILNEAKKITEEKLSTKNRETKKAINLSHIFSHVSHTNYFT